MRNILLGAAISIAAALPAWADNMQGITDTTIKIGVDAPLAAPGRYRFVR